MKTQQRFPSGWDEKRVQRVIAYYEAQTEEEAIAEDEAAFEEQQQTMMAIPCDKHYGFGLGRIIWRLWGCILVTRQFSPIFSL